MVFDSAWIALVMMSALAIATVRREVTRAEWIVFLVFVVNFLLIQVQLNHGLDVVDPYVDWRYQMPGWGLVILLTVGMLIRLLQRESRRFVRALVLVVVAAVVIRPAYKSTKRYCKYRNERLAVETAESWAADYIRADWTGPSRGDWKYYVQEYHTDHLPIIIEHLGGVAHAVGGRPSLTFMDAAAPDGVLAIEIPDYILIRRGYQPRLVDWFQRQGGVIVGEYESRGFVFLLLKRLRQP